MHDAKGNPLKKGDTVVIPCKVTALISSPDHANVGLETLGGRLPDGLKEQFINLNTKQLYRANDGDDFEIRIAKEGGHEFLT